MERIGRLLLEARQAAEDNAEPKGRIVLGALETATALRLPPVLAAYAAACPAVDIEIGTGTSAELVEAVLTRRLEAAFVAAPVHHADLVSTPVASEELVLVTAPWIGDLSALAQAAGEALKIIVFRPGCSYRAQLEALLASRGLLGLRRLEFGTLDGIIGCVAAGIGLTLLPRIVVARAAAEGRVALHALPPKLARVDTLLVHRADAFVSVALQRFFDIARDVLAAGAAGQAGSRAPRRVAPAAKSRSRASSRSMAPPANSSRKSPVKSRA